MGDGFPSDEDIPVTIGSSFVFGDVFPNGADHRGLRLVDTTTGGGLLTTNSDPQTVGIDPLTGEDAPVGTDVGFGAPLRRYVQTGVLNGDFAVPPLDPSQSVSDSNLLPFWIWTPGSDQQLTHEPNTGAASGHVVSVRSNLGSTDGTLVQWIAIPRSQGQQWRALLSGYFDDVGSGSTPAMSTQFYKGDGTTAVGSSLSNSVGAGLVEAKFDLGLVPPTASYVKLSITFPYASQTFTLYEVRCAFLPAEATIGLRSKTSFGAATTTTERSIVSAYIPADSCPASSTYRFTVTGYVTSTTSTACTFRVRYGPTSLSGTEIVTMNPSATTTASAVNTDAFTFTGHVTFRSAGATGTAVGTLQMVARESQPFAVGHRVDVSPSPVTVDTTTANFLEFTAQTAAATTSITFVQAFVECVMAS